MKRRLWGLVVANCLFGLSFGIYDIAFPLFLDHKEVALSRIGLVLGAAALANFLIVIYGGRLSDRFGRKGVYGASFLLCAGANFATPFGAGVATFTLLKTVQQTCDAVRKALRGVLAYEWVAGEAFARFFGRLAGLEMCFHAAGYVLVGMVGLGPAAMLSYRGLFAISGASLAVGLLIFATVFRERPLAEAVERARLSLGSVFTFDLHPKLYILVASGFIFSIGLGTSHALWTLYFARGFDGPWAGHLWSFDAWLHRVCPAVASVWTSGEGGTKFALVSLLAIWHRLLLGIPMFLVAPLLRGKRLKALLIGGLAFEGAVIAATAVADWAWGSLALVILCWLSHDIVGASIWFPIQEQFIQRYSRPQQRGADVAKVRALMALGLVLGPILAGHLMLASPALPFFVGGGLVLLASLILIRL